MRQTRHRVVIGLVQMRGGDDPQTNFIRAQQKIIEAVRQGAQIICLQELFRSRYFPQREDHRAFRLAESIPGPSTQALGRLAEEQQVVIIAGLFEKRAAGVYHNTAVVIDADGKLLGSYRKMHIPDDPLYYEKFYFTPGDLGFRRFRTRYADLGVLVCWDQWFPEAARLTTLQGAEILFYPTAIGWHAKEKKKLGSSQRDAWLTIQRSHAIANGVFVAAINRVGQEGPVEFWGSSFVCDPLGVVLAQASQSREEVLLIPCDLRQVDQTRTHWPFLRDRRVDAYKAITQRFRD